MLKRAALLTGAALALTTGLAACGTSPAAAPADASQPKSDQLTVLQTSVQDQPLLCVRDKTGYGAISCNWEAWNKANAGTK